MKIHMELLEFGIKFLMGFSNRISIEMTTTTGYNVKIEMGL